MGIPNFANLRNLDPETSSDSTSYEFGRRMTKIRREPEKKEENQNWSDDETTEYDRRPRNRNKDQRITEKDEENYEKDDNKDQKFCPYIFRGDVPNIFGGD